MIRLTVGRNGNVKRQMKQTEESDSAKHVLQKKEFKVVDLKHEQKVMQSHSHAKTEKIDTTKQAIVSKNDNVESELTPLSVNNHIERKQVKEKNRSMFVETDESDDDMGNVMFECKSPLLSKPVLAIDHPIRERQASNNVSASSRKLLAHSGKKGNGNGSGNTSHSRSISVKSTHKHSNQKMDGVVQINGLRVRSILMSLN